MQLVCVRCLYNKSSEEINMTRLEQELYNDGLLEAMQHVSKAAGCSMDQLVSKYARLATINSQPSGLDGYTLSEVNQALARHRTEINSLIHACRDQIPANAEVFAICVYFESDTSDNNYRKMLHVCRVAESYQLRIVPCRSVCNEHYTRAYIVGRRTDLLDVLQDIVAQVGSQIVKIDLENAAANFTLGSISWKNNKCVVSEFSTIEGFCGRPHATNFDTILKAYGDKGDSISPADRAIRKMQLD